TLRHREQSAFIRVIRVIAVMTLWGAVGVRLQRDLERVTEMAEERASGRYAFHPSLVRRRFRSYAALINDRCESACGKFPRCSPLGPISSENNPRWLP